MNKIQRINLPAKKYIKINSISQILKDKIIIMSNIRNLIEREEQFIKYMMTVLKNRNDKRLKLE